MDVLSYLLQCLLILVYSEGLYCFGKNDNGVHNLFKTIGDLASILTAEECVFTCPYGGQVIPRRNYSPTSNGCGAYEMQLPRDLFPPLTKCCDVHDICYGTCGKERADCDEKLKTCMDELCDSVVEKLKKRQTKSAAKDSRKVCMSTNSLLYAGVTTLGCQAYLEAQKQACTCSTLIKGEF